MPWFISAILIAVALVGLSSLFPDETSRFPVVLRLGFTALVLIIIAFWCGVRFIGELRAVVERYRYYPRLYDLLEDLHAAAVREREQVDDLMRKLAAIVLHPAEAQAVVFEITRVLTRLDDLSVVIVSPDGSRPPLGELLLMADRVDGRWKGSLEVVDQPTLSGDPVARIIAADPVLHGYLKAQAESGQPLDIATCAIYVAVPGPRVGEIRNE